MIYLVTDRKIAAKDFYWILKEAVAAGIEGIILREKDLETEALLRMAKKVKAIVAGSRTRLIINGNLAVAKEIGADGYHSGFENFINGDRENLKNFTGKIGVSVHSCEEAAEAERRGAHYLLAGHIFETSCKKGLEPRGVAWLREILDTVQIPVIAIGGIDQRNLNKLQSLGLHGAAVRSLIMKSPEPKNTVRELRHPGLNFHE